MAVDRRTVLWSVAAAVVAAGCGTPRTTPVGDAPGRPSTTPPTPPAPPRKFPDRPEVLTGLPGPGNQVALTIDDGTNTAVVAALIRFCKDSGVRLTFFPNGVNPSWTVNAGLLRPLVESGQIQLGNHTWSHPKVTRLSLTGVADQIRRNAVFLRKTYGVDGTPYFRPPWGLHTPATDRVAADLGYTTIALWSTTIGDSRPVTPQKLVGYAGQAMRPQQVVLGHANQTAITHTYAQLLDLIASRGLQTVTLADVFG